MRKAKVGELVLDFNIYPRANIDNYNVNTIAEALTAGVELPHIIIDKKSKRVVDGFHRVRAYQKIYGDDCEVEVIEKSYRDDKQLFLDSIRYNANHGAKLDSHDRAHCSILANQLVIDDTHLADALSITVDKLSSLMVSHTAVGKGGLAVPIKRTISHMRGKKLTNKQADANKKLSGMNQSFYANQIITLIENDLLNVGDDKLMQRLDLLRGLLNGLLEKAA